MSNVSKFVRKMSNLFCCPVYVQIRLAQVIKTKCKHVLDKTILKDE